MSSKPKTRAPPHGRYRRIHRKSEAKDREARTFAWGIFGKGDLLLEKWKLLLYIGIYRGYIGMMEKDTETTIWGMGSGFRVWLWGAWWGSWLGNCILDKNILQLSTSNFLSLPPQVTW